MNGKEEYYEEYWDYRKKTDHLYSDWTPPRIRSAVEIIGEKQPHAPRILDVGCGTGTLGKTLARDANVDDYEIIGIDISEQPLEFATEYYDSTHVADVDSVELQTIVSEEFDVIVCLEVLEHIFHPARVLENVKYLLSDDGKLIASFPNFVYWGHRLDMLRGQPPQKYTLYSDPEHIQDFTKQSFSRLLTDTGFTTHNWYTWLDSPRFVPGIIESRYPSLFAKQMVCEASPNGIEN